MSHKDLLALELLFADGTPETHVRPAVAVGHLLLDLLRDGAQFEVTVRLPTPDETTNRAAIAQAQRHAIRAAHLEQDRRATALAHQTETALAATRFAGQVAAASFIAEGPGQTAPDRPPPARTANDVEPTTTPTGAQQ